MTSTHRTREGDWAECLTPETCPLPYHAPGLTIEEAEATPLLLLLPLFEIADPPSFEPAPGYKLWTKENSASHRDYDLPSEVHPDGAMFWAQNGFRHRDRDKPARVFANGRREWYQEGKLHREGGPAIIEPDGKQQWYRNSLRHRADGPAVIHPDGRTEWWINDSRTFPPTAETSA